MPCLYLRISLNINILNSLIVQEVIPMNLKWKTIFIKIIIWLATEIYLNLLGLDTLADYSEFILVRDTDKVVLIPFLINS